MNKHVKQLRALFTGTGKAAAAQAIAITGLNTVCKGSLMSEQR